jgi:hypothetical protein
VHDENGAGIATHDITKYVFEKTEYDMLSGFSGVFPYSKTYALYYTMGARNIEGLWYRVEDAVNDFLNVFKSYALANVYRDVSGESLADEKLLSRLSFQVTYIPIINGRARQEKTEHTGLDRLVMAYNQSANTLSAKAFGENLRGQIAMMANADRSLMYVFKDLSDVPTPGTLYDNTHYIESVTTRVFPGYCVAQIDLSENFNALGAYTELKTDIRQYEIPRGEDRFTLLEEFCVIGKQEPVDQKLMCTGNLKSRALSAFQANTPATDIAGALVQTFNDAKEPLSETITLPVYSSSLGNSAYLGFCFQDNFSAGTRAADIGQEYLTADHVPYGDRFYAQAKYLSLSLVEGFDKKTGPSDFMASAELPVASALESFTTYVRVTRENPLIWNKDSADVGNVAYQLHFVSNDGYVIGSELSRMMPFLRTAKEPSTETAKIYFYDHRINQITGDSGQSITDGLVATSTLTVNADDLNEIYSLTVDTLPSKPFTSWVIKRSDNRCIIGKNANTVDKHIYFNFKRKR